MNRGQRALPTCIVIFHAELCRQATAVWALHLPITFAKMALTMQLFYSDDDNVVGAASVDVGLGAAAAADTAMLTTRHASLQQVRDLSCRRRTVPAKSVDPPWWPRKAPHCQTRHRTCRQPSGRVPHAECWLWIGRVVPTGPCLLKMLMQKYRPCKRCDSYLHLLFASSFPSLFILFHRLMFNAMSSLQVCDEVRFAAFQLLYNLLACFVGR